MTRPLDLRALEAQLRRHGHNDTCELRVIGMQEVWTRCTCGHDGALALLTALRATRADIPEAIRCIAAHGNAGLSERLAAVLAQVKDG